MPIIFGKTKITYRNDPLILKQLIILVRIIKYYENKGNISMRQEYEVLSTLTVTKSSEVTTRKET